MKLSVIFISILLGTGILSAQDIPAHLTLKEGNPIDIHSFKQLDCSGKRYFDNYILVKGKYNDIVTELKDFSDISRIEFNNFDEDPKMTGDHDRGSVVVTKKNGVSVRLEDATVSLSCYGVNEKINELQFQMINPLTEQLVELKVSLNNIRSIEFK